MLKFYRGTCQREANELANDKQTRDVTRWTDSKEKASIASYAAATASYAAAAACYAEAAAWYAYAAELKKQQEDTDA